VYEYIIHVSNLRISQLLPVKNSGQVQCHIPQLIWLAVPPFEHTIPPDADAGWNKETIDRYWWNGFKYLSAHILL